MTLAVAPPAALNGTNISQVHWALPSPLALSPGNYLLVLREDLTKGQRVAGYKMQAFCSAVWVDLAQGETIGPQRVQIIAGPAAHSTCSEMRLLITSAYTDGGDPRLTQVGMYNPYGTVAEITQFV